MNTIVGWSSWRVALVAALLAWLVGGVPVFAQTDPVPSWNEGPAKKSIIDFVHATTGATAPTFVPPEARIAVFDQDGTTWVSHPMYTQIVYRLKRVAVLAKAKPELKNVEPFKTVLSGNRAAMAKLSRKDLETILAATLTGMTVDAFHAEVEKWIATAKHPRWDRLYTERVYGIRPEQVVGTMGGTTYGYTKDGKPILTKDPKLLLNDDKAGKPQGIHLMIGRRPYAAFGNSNGDQQMLEYTGAGDGARLTMLVLHDDAEREYAYGPAQGLPDTKVGTFTQALYDEATKKSWSVISMKNDWKRIFAFEP